MDSLERQHIPMIVLFSRSDCHFCHEVRTNYLLPMVRTIPEEKIVIRELISDLSTDLIGADGVPLGISRLLKMLKVNFFPTVVFLGSGLRVLAEPLIGLDRAGFYGAYLDQRIEHALKNA